jgi:Zn-dependent peptidase ImmA (M78 family)
LGHLVLHSERTSVDPESEANAFAGALLFPRAAVIDDGIGEHTTLNQYARVKARFGVSIQALVMRAAATGAISDERKRSLFIQISGRGWRKNEPVEIVVEYPVLLRKLFETQELLSMSNRDLEKASGLPVGYLRAMAPPPPKVSPSGSSVTSLFPQKRD